MQNKSKRTSQKGFTLVEIMVVIVILGMLAVLVVPNVMSAFGDAEQNTAKSDVVNIKGALTLYYLKHHRLPESLEELVVEDDKGDVMLEGFDGEIPRDPWGEPYELRQGESARKFEVISYGPDITPDTDDDISSNRVKQSGDTENE